ncbi:hypothetical protein GW17_00028028 [Ensete ventricosum]|nr:hypothetical protein GW17_00028028 [Ensete ventricosum]
MRCQRVDPTVTSPRVLATVAIPMDCVTPENRRGTQPSSHRMIRAPHTSFFGSHVTHETVKTSPETTETCHP